MSSRTHLVWFRSDLRVADNPALHAACADPEARVLGLFLCTPEQWRSFDWGQNRVRWTLRNLRALSKDLAGLGIPLRFEQVPNFAAAPAVLCRLVQDEQLRAVFVNEESELDERRRDEAVTDALAEVGVALHGFTAQTILPPELPRTQSGGFYTVFTPFRRRFLAALEEAGGCPVLPVPAARAAALALEPDLIPMELADFPGTAAESLPPAGAAAGQQRLERFVAQGLAGYARDRDRPDLDGTSGLSPYLAVGALSPRQCWQVSLAEEGEAGDTWRSELCWREFYKHVVLGFPQVCRHRPFKPATDSLPWSRDEERFAAWCEGRSGVPIVDAAMRQLRTRGWMHNRLRMVVAMYLSKNLFIDWRLGERYFNEQLVDADFASNNGGWQWSASTGTDAAPYFRIFNPRRQSERFDPEGRFLRHWLPELSGIEGSAMHDPERLPPLQRGALDYPRPLVDLGASRRAAIARFKAL